MNGGVARMRQVLPADFAATLQQMRGDARLDAVLAAAHYQGWTFTALGVGLGVSRQRVAQRIARGRAVAADPAGVDVPAPPAKPVPVRVQATALPGGRELDELRAMQSVAATVRGGMAVDHPARRVSEQFSARLAELVDRGVPAARLARQLGVAHGSVARRLGRHGYRPLPPSLADKPVQRYRNRKTPPPLSVRLDVDVDALVARHRQDVPIRVLAAEFGVGRTTVRNRLVEAGALRPRGGEPVAGERCEPLLGEHGEVIATVRVTGDLDDETRTHLRNIIEAAKRMHAEALAADPSLAERAEESRRRIAERNRRLRGETG